jgi:hypothetical protein
MRRYHHIGIPTTEAKPGEAYLKHLQVFIVSHEKSEFGVEWMRFELDAAVPDLVRQVPHVAFEVDDLARELAGREVLIAPNSPSGGVRVAFIVENGAPIELLEFTDPNHPARRLRNRFPQPRPQAGLTAVPRRGTASPGSCCSYGADLWPTRPRAVPIAQTRFTDVGRFRL